MKSVKVHFTTYTDVKKFVDIVSQFPFDVDLVSGRYVVNGKSLVGIFSLDLAKDIQLDIYSEEPEALLSQIQSFVVS